MEIAMELPNVLIRHGFRRTPILKELQTRGFTLSQELLNSCTYDDQHENAHVIERMLERIDEARIADEYYVFINRKRGAVRGSFSDTKFFDSPPLNLEKSVLAEWNKNKQEFFDLDEDILPLGRGSYVGFFKHKFYLAHDLDGETSGTADKNCDTIFYEACFQHCTNKITPMVTADCIKLQCDINKRQSFYLFICPEKDDTEEMRILRVCSHLEKQKPSLASLVVNLVREEIDRKARELLAK